MEQFISFSENGWLKRHCLIKEQKNMLHYFSKSCGNFGLSNYNLKRNYWSSNTKQGKPLALSLRHWCFPGKFIVQAYNFIKKRLQHRCFPLNISYFLRTLSLKNTYFFIYFIESLLKMIKNAFCFILQALFVLKIFNFLSWLSGHVEKTAWLER